MLIRTVAGLLAVGLVVPMAAADAFYDETVNGDLSDDRFNPAVFGLSLGTSSLIMESLLANLPQPEGDRDYFTLVVGAGQTLTEIIYAESLLPNGGFDNAGFLALQFGPVVTVNPDLPDPTPLAGFIIGSPDLVGTNVLGALSGGLSELGAGEYAFWFQQTGEDLNRVRFDFTVVPAPGAMALLGMGGLVGIRRRR